MTAGEAAGWLAVPLTLLTFSMRSLTALRIVAVAASISFIAYGVIVSLAPVVVLHLLLVLCNLIRLRELFADSQDRRAQSRKSVKYFNSRNEERS